MFAQPLAFWLLLTVPLISVLFYVAARGRRKLLAHFGRISVVSGLLDRRPGARPRRHLLLMLAIVALVLAIAGPRWGKDRNAVAPGRGRDIVVVLDASRSMLAEQPSRQERARRALLDFCKTLKTRGGHRVALVVFAARPRLVVPLTRDYEHFCSKVMEQDAADLPADLRPDADEGLVSGTRFGQAIRLATAVHVPDAQGSQDILLISDGDDPANDEEWREGSAAAREQKIAIYTVGIGDPESSSTIPAANGPLRFRDKLVESRLREAPLKEIARSTGGLYFPAQTKSFPLGQLFRTTIEPRGAKERSLDGPLNDDPLPLRLRYAWFLGAALAIFAAHLLVRERLPRRRPRTRTTALALTSIVLAICSVSAGPQPDTQELIRRGNEAFAAEDWQRALDLYKQAEELITDPGLVSFNEAAALFRLQRYEEAALRFRRCLEDQKAPDDRRARCLYDLGNCLVRLSAGEDRHLLDEAIECYRACLLTTVNRSDLLADARQNLRIAKLLWLKATPPPPNPKDGSDSQNPSVDGGTKDEPKSSNEKGDQNGGGQPEKVKTASDVALEKATKKLAAGGTLTNLPDEGKLVPLSADNTAALLEREIQRILRDREKLRRPAPIPSNKVKDW